MALKDTENIYIQSRRLRLRQCDLARATGISESRISKILREHIQPKEGELEKIKSALKAREI